MKKIPDKVVIEMTAEGYAYRVYNEVLELIWEDRHVMNGPGFSEGIKPEDIYDCKLFTSFPEFEDAIDDLSFGPFGVSQALWSIHND